MRKRSLALLLTASLSIGSILAGCGTQAQSTDTSKESSENTASDETAAADEKDSAAEDVSQGGKKKVMIAAANMAEPFYAWIANAAASELTENYPDVEYKIIDLQGDAANVPTVIEQAVVEGYDGLILDKVSHDQDTDALLQDARDNGVYTVLSNNLGVKDGVSSSSGASNYLLGKYIGMQAAEMMKENAKLTVVLSTPGDSGSEDRWSGFQDSLKEEGRDDVEVLAVNNTDGWAKEKAMAIMEDWLQVYPEIDAVVAMNDSMALGCVEACRADGRDLASMQFFGIDGLGDGCLAIQSGELTASVLQNGDDMGRGAAKIVMKMISGEITEPEEYLITPTIVTSDNVEEIIAIHKANGTL